MDDQFLSARAKVSDIQSALGFDKYDWANFMSFARSVHTEMCKESVWGDSNSEWRSIPSSEQGKARLLMLEKTGPLFKSQVSQSRIETAIEGRLYQARRNWQQGIRRAASRENDKPEFESHDMSTPEAKGSDIMRIQHVISVEPAS